MKVLFWKEWRETKMLLFVGILLTALSPLYTLFTDYWGRITGYLFFLLMFFAALIGAQAFSREKGKLTYLLSKPVRKQSIMTVKLVNGLVNILIIMIISIAVAVGMCLYKQGGIPHRIYHLEPVSDYFLCYVISFFMSSLFLNVPASFLIGCFGSYSIYATTEFFLQKWGYVQLCPIFLVGICLISLFLAYFTFMRREVRE